MPGIFAAAARPRERPAYLKPGLIVLVAAGGVVGTFARYGLGELFPTGSGRWPVTTFAVNVAGAFALGLLLEAITRLGDGLGDNAEGGPRAKSRLRTVRLGVGTGALGSFTTYSTFAVDTDLLFHDSHPAAAVSYMAATLIVGLITCSLGIAVGAWATRRRLDRTVRAYGAHAPEAREDRVR